MIVKRSKKVPQKHFEMFVKAFNLRIASGFTKMDGRKKFTKVLNSEEKFKTESGVSDYESYIV